MLRPSRPTLLVPPQVLLALPETVSPLGNVSVSGDVRLAAAVARVVQSEGESGASARIDRGRAKGLAECGRIRRRRNSQSGDRRGGISSVGGR